MKPFDGKTFIPIFKELAKAPESQLEPFLAERCAEFINFGEHTDKEVWNFAKEMLDDIVYTSGASPFVMALIDFERFYEAPEGAYKQSDGSIHSAPWRNKKDIQ